jgi:hypothetical protein
MEASHASRITIAIISDLKQVLSSLFAVRHLKQLFFTVSDHALQEIALLLS